MKILRPTAWEESDTNLEVNNDIQTLFTLSNLRLIKHSVNHALVDKLMG